MWNKIKMICKKKTLFDEWVSYPFPSYFWSENDINIRKNDDDVFKADFFIHGKKHVLIADKKLGGCNLRFYPTPTIENDNLLTIFEAVLLLIEKIYDTNYFSNYNFEMNRHYKLMDKMFNFRFNHLNCRLI